MEEMPEDLVCKFLWCISVGSWQNPWRINGPARMKGRERRRGESFLSRESLSSICGEQCLSLSFFFNLSLWSRQFLIFRSFPSFSLFFDLLFHLFFSLFFSHFSISPERSASIQPSNKRTDPVYSRGSERLWIEKKRRNRHLSAVHPHSSVSLPPSLQPNIWTRGEMYTRNVSMLPLSPLISSYSRKRKHFHSSWLSDPQVNRLQFFLRDEMQHMLRQYAIFAGAFGTRIKGVLLKTSIKLCLTNM